MLLCTTRQRAAAFLCILLAGILLPKSSPCASSLQKERVARAVYKHISTAIRDYRQAPAFNFIPVGDFMSDNAFFNPENTTINLGEKIYDICASFGADSLNALALVLGHELAHFYKDHEWGLAFGTAHFNSGIGEEIYDLSLTPQRKREMEAEADYFGAFFAYAAGYNALEIGPAFYDSLYKALKIPDDTEGYPSRADRVAISESVEEELNDLAQIFDAATYLAVIGEDEMAGRCLVHVQRKLPSTSVMNNAGLCFARAALGTFKEGELRFAYPFGLDSEHHIPRYTPRGHKDPIADRERLLTAAKNLFSEVVRADGQHVQAHLNLALVEALRGESLMARAFADKALKLAEEEKDLRLVACAYLALGILAADAGEMEEAKAHFEAAREESPLLAGWNLRGLEEGEMEMAVLDAGSKSELEESIGADELEPGMAEILLYDSRKLEIKGEYEGQGDLEVRSAKGADWKAISIKQFSYPMLRIKCLITTPNYPLGTTRGIHLGDHRKTVQEKYGMETGISLDRRFEYAHHPSEGMVFVYDRNNLLRQWILYAKH